MIYQRNELQIFQQGARTMYAVYNLEVRLYFAWCYTNKAFAETMVKRLATPMTETDRLLNWRKETRYCVKSDRTAYQFTPV